VNLLQAAVLGVVEGLTEYLPVSSTGHLTIAERMMGLRTDNDAVTAFTAVIQTGAIVAVILYFRREIAAVVVAFVRGIFNRDLRDTVDYKLGWWVIVGTIPIGIAGLLLRHVIEGPLRSLWAVVAGLVIWSGVMVLAERGARQDRTEADLTITDAIAIGLFQVVALVPGVSRSGATISGGLFRGLDRVAATRFAFLLSIPALLAAGVFELPSAIGQEGVSVAALVLGTAISFVVGYASIAWLLRFVAHHPITAFVPYRLGVAAALAVALLAFGVSATG
jgi:undecaprenyl-diphosphatase